MNGVPMTDKRKITASCLLKVNGRAVRVQLSPASIYGGPEGAYRVRVNRVWRNGYDGNPLFVDRGALAALLADALYGVPLLDAPVPDLPRDARVCVNIRRDEDVYDKADGWTYSTPIRADDGQWYVLVSAQGRRFFANCADVFPLPASTQPSGIRRRMR